MNGKQTGSVILAVIGALVFGLSASAFGTVRGDDAIAASGDVGLAQIINVLGMLLGGGMTLAGGGLLAWIKGKLPERVGPLVDDLANGLAARLQRGQPVSGDLLAIVGMLQALKHGPFKGDAEAVACLDKLVLLAWNRDNEAALSPPTPGGRKGVSL